MWLYYLDKVAWSGTMISQASLVTFNIRVNSMENRNPCIFKSRTRGGQEWWENLQLSLSFFCYIFCYKGTTRREIIWGVGQPFLTLPIERLSHLSKKTLQSTVDSLANSNVVSTRLWPCTIEMKNPSWFYSLLGPTLTCWAGVGGRVDSWRVLQGDLPWEFNKRAR
jgi:hypothetical protein